MLQLGDTFCRGFKVVGVVGGEGTSAEAIVYILEHEESGARVVAKTPQEKVGKGIWLPLYMQYTATQLLSAHPNFVKCLDFVNDKGLPYLPTDLRALPSAFHVPADGWGDPYLILEYVDAPTLTEVLRVGHRRFHEAVDWWVQIASAIEYARSLNYIVVQLSNDNILITAANLVRILDVEVTEVLQEGLVLPLVFKSLPADRLLYADSSYLARLMHHTLNLTIIEEWLAAVSYKGPTERNKWEAEWRHMADVSDHLYQLSGNVTILDSHALPSQMRNAMGKIISVITRLGSQMSKKEPINFKELVMDLVHIHEQLDVHPQCPFTHVVPYVPR